MVRSLLNTVAKEVRNMAENVNDQSLSMFEKQKTRVLEFARELKAVAADRRDDDSVAALETLGERLDSNRFLVVAIGEFKRGKSTMVNALVGRAVCPMKMTPHTARVTRILAASGEEEYVEIKPRDGQAKREPLGPNALDDLVAMRGKRLKDVDSVDVYVKPSGGLVQSGLVIVDTPGLESLEEEHDRITKEFLPRADLVIFALSAMQPFGARERDFLLSHRDVVGKSLFVLNHMDQVPEAEKDETVKWVADKLREQVLGSKATDVALFPISALNALKALEAQGEDKSALLDRSGVPKLASEIVKILSAERGRPVLGVIADGEKRVALNLAKQVRAAREAHATRLPVDAEDFRRRASTLHQTLREKSGVLERAVISEIDEEVRELAASVSFNVAQGREHLKRIASSLVASYPDENVCKQNLPSDLAPHVQAWLDNYEGTLRKRFKRITDAANRKCDDGFDELEKDAITALEQSKAALGLAGITGGLAALADLSAIANCLGGPIGGYGVASSAVNIAFEVPPAVKALTVGAGVVSVLAVFTGPIGWTAALLGWIAVGLTNLVRSAGWRSRVTTEVENAIDREVGPRAERAVAGAIWGFGRSLQEHLANHIRRVQTKLGAVVKTLTDRIESDSVAVKRTIEGLDSAEKRLLSIADEITKFVGELPPVPVKEAPAPESQPPASSTASPEVSS